MRDVAFSVIVGLCVCLFACAAAVPSFAQKSEREDGLDVIQLKNGGMLTEDFRALDGYIAKSGCKIHESMPEFAEGYREQKGKETATSRALESYLKQRLPYAFKALAGENRVDVVTLQENGKSAYAFIITKMTDDFMVGIEGNRFYYNIPEVLGVLESFIGEHQSLAREIWASKGSGYIMFIVQEK